MKKLLLLLSIVCFCSIANAQWGDALHFNGSNQYANLGAPVTTVTDNLTMEAWVKWAGNNSQLQSVVSNGSVDQNDGYTLILNADGYISILVSNSVWGISGSVLQAGVWTHLAMVRNSGNWSLYINGTSIAMSSVTNQEPNTPSTDFYVGTADHANSFFNGTIDEVRISNEARYTSNFTPPSEPFTTDGSTVGLYHFDEGIGSTAHDASTNHLDLTLVNSPTWILDDNPLDVEATDFMATADVGSVTLSWKTESEVSNAGFNVLREDPSTSSGSTSLTTSFKLIASYRSDNSLKGLVTSTTGRTYKFTDTKVTSGSTYEYKIQSVSTNGTTEDLTTLSVTVDVPKNYALYQNFPNPFNPSTTIRFDLKEGSTVTLDIYNVLGQRIMEQDYGTMNAGRYNEVVNMDKYASGVYFYRVSAVGNSSQGGSPMAEMDRDLC